MSETKPKRTPKRVQGVQKTVDAWLKHDMTVKKATVERDEQAKTLRETARDLQLEAEPRGVEALTLRLDGSKPGTGVDVVFTSRGKAIPVPQASVAASLLGPRTGEFLEERISVEFTGDLARWLVDAGILAAFCQQHGLASDRPDLKVCREVVPTNSFLERRAAYRQQGVLTGPQVDCLLQIQRDSLSAPTVRGRRPTTPLPESAGPPPAPPPPPGAAQVPGPPTDSE